jgi:hypothetical protein
MRVGSLATAFVFFAALGGYVQAQPIRTMSQLPTLSANEYLRVQLYESYGQNAQRRPMICQPGMNRCGADGYVQTCSPDGTYWMGSKVPCR